MCSQLVFEKRPKKTQWWKANLFNKWYWENWIFTCNRINWIFILYYLKKFTQWIKDLKVRCETTKLEGNREEALWHASWRWFVEYHTKSTTKVKLTKEDCVKLKCFCPAKENNKVKRPHMEWEKVFASYVSGKRLIPKIYEKLIQLDSKNKHMIK